MDHRIDINAPIPPDMPLGEAAYAIAAPFVRRNVGRPAPTWEDLPDSAKAMWDAVAMVCALTTLVRITGSEGDSMSEQEMSAALSCAMGAQIGAAKFPSGETEH